MIQRFMMNPYTGAYNRSWETIQRNLNENPTIQVTIDVHRDALGGRIYQNQTYNCD